MYSMKHRTLEIRHLWPVLCCLTALCSAVTSSPSCHETLNGAEKGIVRPPQFPSSTAVVNCSWVLRAAPGFKLLVRVDIVEFAPSSQRTSSLALTVDSEVYEIGRNCVTCLSELVAGEVIRIHFMSSLVPSTKTETELGSEHSQPYTGSFQIRYKSFNPNYCERPRSPNNGYVFGKDWKVGSEITYHCNPPYDLVGDDRAQCTVPAQVLVPEWSQFPPRCILNDCRPGRGTTKRLAGAGAIASPGYMERRLPAGRKCEWEIKSEPGHQIKVAFTQLKLPERAPNDSPHLYLFDGDVNTPLANLSGVEIGNEEQSLNMTTVSNRLIVVLLTGGKVEENAVMYMEYAAHPGTCPDPGHPQNGKLIAYNMLVGSTVAFRCDPGFVLTGEPRAECLPTGIWSASVPTCVPTGAAELEHQDVSVDLHAEHGKDDDLRTAFPGEHRGFTPPPTTPIVPVVSSSVAPTKTPMSKAKTVPAPKIPTKSSTVKPVTAPHASHPDDDLLDPIFHVSGGKPSVKEDHEWSKHHQQDVFSRDAQKDLGQPKRPLAHLNPRPSSLLPTPSLEGQDVNLQSSKDSRSRDTTPTQQGLNVTMLAVIVAVAAPLTIALMLMVVIILYRRKYPVRMRFGRKFSTFENPVYVKKDVQDPRELTRLSADRDRF
ncbi:CUB and sushi domain-containing protein 3-like [Ornithodoros turicata]|uniref:CUB and sushi domain-containing protein 3-like n=1 Tax=Ornithodoros turicata TaxID=34597 RepID=UPI003138CB37